MFLHEETNKIALSSNGDKNKCNHWTSKDLVS